MSDVHLLPIRRSRLPWARAALAVLTLAPTAAAGQTSCIFAEGGNDRLRSLQMPGGVIYYVTNPHLRCEDGVEIWADSAVAYTAQNLTHLIGDVRFVDPARELNAQEARYFSNVGRLQAQGSLYVKDADQGSVIENGDLVYLRKTDFRAEDLMTVTTGSDRQRPLATLNLRGPEDGEAGAGRVTPYEVVGDEIFLRGSAYFRSNGSVEIRRDSLSAFADSVEYDRTGDRIRLRGSALVDTSAYDLEGDSIDIVAPESDSSQVRSMRNAVLTGEDLRLRSPSILLFLVDGAVERLVAMPLTGAVGSSATAATDVDTAVVARPVAESEDFEITADSLEVLAPANVVRRLFAAGSARSVSHSRDSLNVASLPQVAQSDWLEGDTIIVLFTGPDDSAAVGDSSQERSRVDRVVAKVSARSLYRLSPSDASSRAGVDPPAVHYVTGNEITIVMADGDVDHMEVVGQTHGVHLEPSRPPPPPPPAGDTIAVPASGIPPATVSGGPS